MIKRKLLPVILATIMTFAVPLTVFAEEKTDGTAASTPAGSGVNDSSTGKATVTGDGTTFNSENDDDDAAKVDDTNGTDINVWAKVIDGSSPVYKIDIAWGAMKFQYESGQGQWDTETHSYVDNGSGTKRWTVDGYLDGTNNKVTVTNHSNKAVSAEFEYNMVLTGNASQFNADSSAASSVKGNFFADNEKAMAAALVLENTSTVADIFNQKLKLHTADKYFDSQVNANSGIIVNAFTQEDKESTGREKSVYFAFSGTPDAGVGAKLDSFTKVGVITVTVAPLTEEELNGFEYTRQ